jgi:crotonobetaine/carnitine-CoA ligase
LVTLGATLTFGLSCVISRHFTKSRLWDVIRDYGCTTFSLLGGMTTALYAEPQRPLDGFNPVRHMVSAGMPAAIWERFEERFGVRILEFYGAAEGRITVNPIGVGPVGSIGKTIPSQQCRIVDDAGNDCAPGTPGELWIRPADGSPFNYPEASAQKWQAAGCTWAMWSRLTKNSVRKTSGTVSSRGPEQRAQQSSPRAA